MVHDAIEKYKLWDAQLRPGVGDEYCNEAPVLKKRLTSSLLSLASDTAKANAGGIKVQTGKGEGSIFIIQLANP